MKLHENFTELKSKCIHKKFKKYIQVIHDHDFKNTINLRMAIKHSGNLINAEEGEGLETSRGSLPQ